MTDAAAAPARHPLFSVYGVEMEYMIVDRSTFDVRPITDELLKAVAGTIVSDIENGDICWSNELVLHVVELKTNGPAKSLDGLESRFQENVRRINGLLAPMNARLMPGAMHPWMDPAREMRLWPHEYSPVYEAYHRIFNCVGHGWSNLQSTHLNLPFDGDTEFERLHAAIRVLLPIMPALSASSPVMEGRLTGFLDNRMEVYRKNSKKVPSLTAHVVPEQVFNEADYRERIFERLYRDIAPHDPDEVLRDEFLNSRGAIARFGRGSVEIRVLDIQECPAADIAVVSAISETLKALVAERWSSRAAQKAFDEVELERILLPVIRDADQAVVDDARYLALFGIQGGRATAGEIWRKVAAELLPGDAASADPVARARRVILERGPLARRIQNSLVDGVSRQSLSILAANLCDCLAEGGMFLGPG